MVKRQQIRRARKVTPRVSGVKKRASSKRKFGFPDVGDETFYPKRSDVLTIKKKYSEFMYKDAAGRWYGKSFPNPVLDDLVERGEVDERKGRYMWWVYLSRRTVDRDDADKETIEPHEMLDFPETDETVQVYAFNDPTKPIGSFKMLYFTENVRKNGRTAHILVQVTTV
jgi:hypothetical protein